MIARSAAAQPAKFKFGGLFFNLEGGVQIQIKRRFLDFLFK